MVKWAPEKNVQELLSKSVLASKTFLIWIFQMGCRINVSCVDVFHCSPHPGATGCESVGMLTCFKPKHETFSFFFKPQQTVIVLWGSWGNETENDDLTKPNENTTKTWAYRWLIARLQYLQCVSNGVTAVLRYTIDIMYGIPDHSMVSQVLEPHIAAWG